MKTREIFRGTTLAGAALLLAVSAGGLRADEYKMEAEVTPLHEGPLTGADGKTVLISHFAVPPGFQTAKHTHPGAVFLYVLEGTLEIETEQGKKTVSAGELLEEVPDLAMIGRNASSSEGAKFIVFQVGDTGKPMMVKAE